MYKRTKDHNNQTGTENSQIFWRIGGGAGRKTLSETCCHSFKSAEEV